MEAKEQTEIRQLGEKLRLSQDKYDIDIELLNENIEDLKNQLIIALASTDTKRVSAEEFTPEQYFEMATANTILTKPEVPSKLCLVLMRDYALQYFEQSFSTTQIERVSEEEIVSHFDYAPHDRKELLVEGAKWMQDRLSSKQGDKSNSSNFSSSWISVEDMLDFANYLRNGITNIEYATKEIEEHLRDWKQINSNNGFILMPEHIDMHNGINERCDMLVGYCACGALHKLEDWKGKIPKKEIAHLIPPPPKAEEKKKEGTI